MFQLLGLAKRNVNASPTQAELSAPDESRPSTTANPEPAAEEPRTVTGQAQPVIPRLIIQSKYLVAVRATDGTLLSWGVPARPSEVIELYGTGFRLANGPARRERGSSSPNSNVQGIKVTVGSSPAEVRFAGRVGPGLYQINLVIPAELPAGDHPVTVRIGASGASCQGLLRIAPSSEPNLSTTGRYSGFMQKAAEARSAASDANSNG